MSWKIDKGLLLVVLFFLGLGLVQVYSSSFIFATESQGSGLHFFKKQLLFVGLGAFTLLVIAYLPFKWLERWGHLIWWVAALGVAMTFFTAFSVKAGGAHRWLQLPMGLRFEPSELLKISFPLLIATFISRPKDLKIWLLRMALVGGVLLLLLKQPDFGSFAICLTVVLGLFFAFGLQWKYIFASALLTVPAFYFLIVKIPYRYARITAFLDPWADPAEKGFQIIQSLLSFHAGRLWGAGLGQGQGKLFFLPEAHTDFTFAVLGEELGFVGVFIVALLYGFLIYRGFQISLRAERVFPRAAALGLTLTLSLAIFINMGVVMGLLPTKGLTLPFLSYGGSSLISTCIAVGLLLNIDRANRTGESQSFRGYKIPT